MITSCERSVVFSERCHSFPAMSAGTPVHQPFGSGVTLGHRQSRQLWARVLLHTTLRDLGRMSTCGAVQEAGKAAEKAEMLLGQTFLGEGPLEVSVKSG